MRTIKKTVLVAFIAVLGYFAVYPYVKDWKSGVKKAAVGPEAARSRQAPSARVATDPSAQPASQPPVAQRRPTAIAPAASAPAPATVSPSAASPNAVALVNGVPITKRELDEEINRLLLSPTAHVGMKAEKKDEYRKSALEELIVRELAYQRAKAGGLSVTKSQFAAAVRKVRRNYNSEKSFRDALRAEEIAEQEFERRVERDLLLKRVAKVEIEDKARVTEADVRRQYEGNKPKFVIPESVRLKNIVIRIEPGEETQAKKKIEDLYRKLEAGADFAELAYRNSEDEYRVMGGDYGWAHRGQLDEELERVAFAAQPGELKGPFMTGFGWHIIRVEGKQPERRLAYEEVRDKIRQSLRQKRRMQRRLEFIGELKSAAKIEYVSL